MLTRTLVVAAAFLALVGGAAEAAWTTSGETPTGLGFGLVSACDPGAGTAGVVYVMQQRNSDTTDFIWAYDIGADSLVDRITLNSWIGCAFPNPRRYADLAVIGSDVYVSGYGCSPSFWYLVSTASPITGTSPTWSGNNDAGSDGTRPWDGVVSYTVGLNTIAAIGGLASLVDLSGIPSAATTGSHTSYQSYALSSTGQVDNCRQVVVGAEFVAWACGRTNSAIHIGGWHESGGSWTELFHDSATTIGVSNYTVQGMAAWPSEGLACASLMEGSGNTTLVCFDDAGSLTVNQTIASSAVRALALGSDGVMRGVQQNNTVLACSTPSTSCFADEGDGVPGSARSLVLEACNDSLVAVDALAAEIYVKQLDAVAPTGFYGLTTLETGLGSSLSP